MTIDRDDAACQLTLLRGMRSPFGFAIDFVFGEIDIGSRDGDAGFGARVDQVICGSPLSVCQ